MEKRKINTTKVIIVVVVAVLLFGIALFYYFNETDLFSPVSDTPVIEEVEKEFSVTDISDKKFCIDDKQVTSISIDDVIIEEGKNGYIIDSDDDDNPIEPYFFYNEIQPTHVTLTFSDGTSERLKYKKFCKKVKSFYGDEAEFEPSGYEQAKETPWCIGKHKARLGNKDTFELEYTVRITENNIESLEINDVILFKDYSGGLEWDYVYDESSDEEVEIEWFNYEHEPYIVKVNYKDGTNKEFTYDELQEEGFHYLVSDNQAFDNQWTVGEHTAHLYFGTEIYDYKVKIGELENIEVAPIEITEGTKGNYFVPKKPSNNNVENDIYEYFRDYYYDYCLYAEYTLKFKDGTSVKQSYKELNNWVVSLEQNDTQNETGWKLGKYIGKIEIWTYDKNSDYVLYEPEIEVTITESPIEGISIPSITVYEDADGNYYTLSYDSGKPVYHEYVGIPGEITIYYKDGTEEIGTLSEFEDYDNGIEFIYGELNYSGDTSFNSDNKYKLRAAFMNAYTEYTVEFIKDSSITSGK